MEKTIHLDVEDSNVIVTVEVVEGELDEFVEEILAMLKESKKANHGLVERYFWKNIKQYATQADELRSEVLGVLRTMEDSLRAASAVLQYKNSLRGTFKMVFLAPADSIGFINRIGKQNGFKVKALGGLNVF